MKIENGANLNRAQLDTIRQTEQAKSSATSVPPSVREGGKDQAEFSPRGLLLSKARGVLEAQPEMRADRVETLSQQIKSGAYQVPYEKLAGKLLNKLL